MPEADELRLVLAALPDGITVQDAEGRFIYANDAAAHAAGFAAAEDMIGADSDEMRRGSPSGTKPASCCRPTSCRGARPWRDARGGRAALPWRRRRRWRPGSGERWVRWSAVPIVDANGRVQRVVSIIHDVTEQRRGDEWQRFLGDASKALGVVDGARDGAGVGRRDRRALDRRLLRDRDARGAERARRRGRRARERRWTRGSTPPRLRPAAETCALELMAADDAGRCWCEASERDAGTVPERARAAVAALSGRACARCWRFRSRRGANGWG